MLDAAMSLARFLFRLLLGRRLPRTEGALAVPGPHGALQIQRDRWGIPYIAAGDDHDAHFGVGFCHGQDRAFQLEVLLRVVRGTVAELVGPGALPVDRISRRIGFHHASIQQEKVLDPDVRAMLEAYAEGARAGATHGLDKRPHEFALLRSHPTPWTVSDSLGVVKLISFTLSSNWDAELARMKILSEDGPAALAALDPAYPQWHPIEMPPGPDTADAIDRLSADLAIFSQFAGLGGASNNWALAGTRTASGRPLLANDPHLDARIPAHWYLANMRTPTWGAAGATFLGGPSIMSGHNGVAAWGMTAGLVDNTDFFREQVGPDGRSIRQGDGFVPCPVREEIIRVKGSADVVEQVLETPRGPIVGPALAGAAGEALSLRALWLDPRPIRGMLCIQQARSFGEFRRACEQWPAVSQNLVYADTHGTVGIQVIGRAPVRMKGWGTLPLAGWDAGAGWEPDLVPFADMPFTENPPEGFVATANTRPKPDDQGPFLGVDWIDGYRLAAIKRALMERKNWNVARTQQLQMDQTSLPWREMAEVVLAAPERDKDVRQALEVLRYWDGTISVESPSATVFELFVAEMVLRVARAKAPRSYPWAVGKPGSVLTDHSFFSFRRVGHLVRLLREQPDGWFERPWPDEIADALSTVINRLKVDHGPFPDHWTWGQLRRLVMRHPLGRKNLLARVFNRGPIPCGGDTDTINQASVFPLDPLAPCNNIASLRTVIDVGEWDNSRFVLPGGQSGNPLSPHYDDLWELWQKGEGVPIAWSPEAVKKATVKTLELRPMAK